MNESNPSDAALAELLTLTVEVTSNGTSIYRNHLDQVHRTHGPAMVFSNGTKKWLQNDKLHRTDGPALVWSNDEVEWYLNGDRFSEYEFHERCNHI